MVTERRSNSAAGTQFMLMGNRDLRRINPAELGVAMIATIGIGGELANVAASAVSAADLFDGHGGFLSERQKLLPRHELTRGGSSQFKNNQRECANGDQDVKEQLDEAINKTVLLAQPMP